jgi:RNA polymerase sigma-70 factor (ECF subfamily)
MGARDVADVRASLDDPERFGTVFDRHHRVVWSYLARLGGRGVADDLAGEVFVRAFAQRANYDPDLGAVRSWLYGIATNLWRNRRRSDVRGAAAVVRLQGRTDQLTTDLEGVASAIDAERALGVVIEALQLLSDADRALVVLYAWEELSYGEISLVLDVPIGTVRSRLSRARQRLRELIEGGGEVIAKDGHAHGE